MTHRDILLKHEFVEFIPETLLERTIYVSITYSTATHKCCCGCGNLVVTPLSPTDWKLIFDGESISIDPSIGNWSFPCQSHYWIRRNRVKWAPRWSKEKIEAGRLHNKLTQKRYYDETNASPENERAEADEERQQEKTSEKKNPRRDEGWWA
jgi:hypothetical protein